MMTRILCRRRSPIRHSRSRTSFRFELLPLWTGVTWAALIVAVGALTLRTAHSVTAVVPLSVLLLVGACWIATKNGPRRPPLDALEMGRQLREMRHVHAPRVD